jgi:tetratricopeptide (TPR) repeat protein
MKKVVLASLLVCATAAFLPSALFAQAAPAPAAPAAGGAPACPPMPDAEYKAYTDAMNQSAPAAKAAAVEAYLTAFPQSCVKLPTLVILMQTYAAANDGPKTIDAAGRVLQLDPANLRALTFEVYFRNAAAMALTDAAAKQSALDEAASYAQKGLAAAKPADISADDFKKLQDAAFPVFYSVIGYDALLKKDSATAIDAYKKELASVPEAQTKTPGQYLQDTFYLGEAYYQANPPDYLNCAFYASRAVAYAPDQFKSQMAPTAKYCYKKYHGADDGYDAVVQAATASLNPPAGFQASIKPAPTPADIIDGIIKTTPDLGTLAVSDKEYILQNGTPDQADKVWQTIKGKSSQFPGALVIASTPTQVQVAISDDAVQSKTADFTFNMKAPEEPAGTAAQKAAAQKTQDAIAAATAVGQTVTLTGTYDSFTPKPIMITMTDGEVVLPKPTKPAAHAPVHHAPARKK